MRQPRVLTTANIARHMIIGIVAITILLYQVSILNAVDPEAAENIIPLSRLAFLFASIYTCFPYLQWIGRAIIRVTGKLAYRVIQHE